ncbi:MAG: MBL fold metallo-hydrolase [Herpetosiphon sp.]
MKPRPRRLSRKTRTRQATLATLIVFIGTAISVIVRWRVVLGAAPRGQRRARIDRSANAIHGRFKNLSSVPTLLPGSLLRTLWLQLTVREGRRPAEPLPIVQTAPDHSGGTTLRVTWLGHATTLIEIDGARILTDPVWSEWAGPFPHGGPRRFHPPPWTLAQLPPLDAVLITHDHYDHLDAATISVLARSTVQFIVPLGIGAHLERWGVHPTNISECDWAEEVTLIAGQSGSTLRLRAVPTQHYSGRSLWRNQTLWAAWVVTGPVHRVYLGCDGGWSSTFEEIGRRFGPFDLATLPIGQYGSTWPYIHMLPEQAVAAAQALDARCIVPIHWGTFALAFHRWQEPAERFVTAADAAGISVICPRPGEVVNLPDNRTAWPHWWRDLQSGSSTRAVIENDVTPFSAQADQTAGVL